MSAPGPHAYGPQPVHADATPRPIAMTGTSARECLRAVAGSMARYSKGT